MNPITILSDTSSNDCEIEKNKWVSDSTSQKYNFTDCAKSTQNEYDLDEFLDDDIELETLETRIKHKRIIAEKLESEEITAEAASTGSSVWSKKFTSDDFCEDSNDFNTILNRISQMEQLKMPQNKENYSRHENNFRNAFKFDVENLIHGDIIEKPISNMCSGVAVTIDSSNSFTSRNSNLKSRSTDLCLNKESKSEKELRKESKALEREQKRLEKEKEKQLKCAQKIIKDCYKPDKCLEYLTVNLDENLLNSAQGKAIKEGLESNNYKFNETKAITANLISWTRKVPRLENMDSFQQESHYLLIMDADELLEHISNDTLISCIQSLLSLQEIKHLSVAIFGLSLYYKYLRHQHSQLPNSKLPIPKCQFEKFQKLPQIAKNDIYLKLVELQIFCKNIYIRHVENCEKLALFVRECTKSVAQLPFKLTREDSLNNENEYFCSKNKDTVRVNKDGNGLNSLWNQFLKMFPLASLETAEAISSVYPTLNSLMKAYRQCPTDKERQELLQDIPVRRAMGASSGNRRIGPEFSKKAFKFFYSINNVVL